MGWIMAMFDLPVTTKAQRAEAASFRKSLLDDGYVMVNFSVYARSCVDWTRMRKHSDRLTEFIPCGGNVHVFFITDKQWTDSIAVIGEDYKRKRKIKNSQMPQQLEFW